MPDRPQIPLSVDQVARDIVDSAYKVHSTLGPGLLESVYEACLDYELRKRNHDVVRQRALPVRYEDLFLDAGFRLDLFVDDCVIIEIKAVERVLPVREAQVLTYLKLTNRRIGLLINFNVPVIKDGIRRLVL